MRPMRFSTSTASSRFLMGISQTCMGEEWPQVYQRQLDCLGATTVSYEVRPIVVSRAG